MSFREKIESEWIEILEFNKKFNVNHEKYTDDVISKLEFVKIPFFPLKLNPYVFYKFNSIFSTIIIVPSTIIPIAIANPLSHRDLPKETP